MKEGKAERITEKGSQGNDKPRPEVISLCFSATRTNKFSLLLPAIQTVPERFLETKSDRG